MKISKRAMHAYAIVLILIGLGSRLFLTFSLPVWIDEVISLRVIQSPIRDLINGGLDPVHPPGYYLFLKLWSTISNSLIWMRLSSVFLFLINTLILYKIASRIRDHPFYLVLLLYYVFSGYFLVFDWQVRMYTGTTTLILTSLLFLSKRVNKLQIVIFTTINSIGLYYDYSFFWYFLPLFIFLFFELYLKNNVRYEKYFFSTLLSSATFLVWLPLFLRNLGPGLNGILWVRPFLHPSFFLPYFLGSHNNRFLTLLFSALTILGIYKFLKNSFQKNIFSILLFSSVTSLFSALLFSIVVTPILHVRSLQIAGIAFLFFSSLATYSILRSKYRTLAIITVFLLILNFFQILLGFHKNPGQYLIRFPQTNSTVKSTPPNNFLKFSK